MASTIGAGRAIHENYTPAAAPQRASPEETARLIFAIFTLSTKHLPSPRQALSTRGDVALRCTEPMPERPAPHFVRQQESRGRPEAQGGPRLLSASPRHFPPYVYECLSESPHPAGQSLPRPRLQLDIRA